MDRATQIRDLLIQVESEIEEIEAQPNLEDLTASEVLVLATELVTEKKIGSHIDYTSPVGVVQRDRVQFVVHKDIHPYIGGVEHDDEDNLF